MIISGLKKGKNNFFNFLGVFLILPIIVISIISIIKMNYLSYLLLIIFILSYLYFFYLQTFGSYEFEIIDEKIHIILFSKVKIYNLNETVSFSKYYRKQEIGYYYEVVLKFEDGSIYKFNELRNNSIQNLIDILKTNCKEELEIKVVPYESLAFIVAFISICLIIAQKYL